MKELCFIYSPDANTRDGEMGFVLDEDLSILNRINLIHGKGGSNINLCCFPIDIFDGFSSSVLQTDY